MFLQENGDITILKDKDGNSLIGRVAEVKEFGQLEIALENKAVVTDVVETVGKPPFRHCEHPKGAWQSLYFQCFYEIASVVPLPRNDFSDSLVKAFAIASLQHKSDILNILEQIKRKCKP